MWYKEKNFYISFSSSYLFLMLRPFMFRTQLFTLLYQEYHTGEACIVSFVGSRNIARHAHTYIYIRRIWQYSNYKRIFVRGICQLYHYILRLHKPYNFPWQTYLHIFCLSSLEMLKYLFVFAIYEYGQGNIYFCKIKFHLNSNH